MDFLGTRKLAFKPKKSKSIPERHIERPLNFQSSPISNELSDLGRMKGSLPLHRLEDAMFQRMNVHNNNGKVATERQIRLKQIHKPSFY